MDLLFVYYLFINGFIICLLMDLLMDLLFVYHINNNHITYSELLLDNQEIINK
jgi:hypothetical protein